MRIRNIKGKKEIINSCKNFIESPETIKGKWHETFNNNNEIRIEIGSGRCRFIYELAKANPNINFVGIEKIDTVMAMGIKKYKLDLPNLRMINFDAKKISDVFDKEISTIYLNFSDPWPKKRHEKRRLTSDVFLREYDKIFKDEKIIIQKTDNSSLFEYSIMSLSAYGYIIEYVTLDLQNSDIHDNIMTEYEEKFTAQNYKIYMQKAVKK